MKRVSLIGPEIFQIKKLQLTNPTTYLLKDANNSDVLGGFYEKQVQKVKYPDAYLVEKNIRKNRDNIIVGKEIIMFFENIVSRSFDLDESICALTNSCN